MNLLGPELVRDLVSLIQQTEAGDALQVLVFKSADPNYFISHVDVTRIKEYREEAARLSGEASIALPFRHLSASRLVTVLVEQFGSGRHRRASGHTSLQIVTPYSREYTSRNQISRSRPSVKSGTMAQARGA